MRKRGIAILALSLVAAALEAQVLSPTSNAPSADGLVRDGEYSFRGTYRDMTLHLSLSRDGSVLYVALEAPTPGWVAAGLGSLRMDGAFMVMAYDEAGKKVVSEETGSGRRHSPNPVRKLASQAVLESGGRTTLEFSLPAAAYISGGSLRMILAYGRRDDLSSMHARYSPAEIPVSL